MTSGFIVVLRKDLSDEDTQKVLDALGMIRDVVDVKPVDRAPTEKRIERARMKTDLRDAVNKFLDEY